MNICFVVIVRSGSILFGTNTSIVAEVFANASAASFYCDYAQQKWKEIIEFNKSTISLDALHKMRSELYFFLMDNNHLNEDCILTNYYFECKYVPAYFIQKMSIDYSYVEQR